jgi:hypothetical protein
MIRRLLVTAGLLAAGCARANDDETRRLDSGSVADNATCLVAPPLVGLRLGDPTAAMRAALGPPIASVRTTDGDDGPAAATMTYRFPRADVRVVRGRVNRIVVTERGGWPRGLAVGSTRAEVDRYTGERRLLRMTTGDTIEVAVCPDDRALLYFRPSVDGRRVSRVELVAAGR